MRKTCPHCGVNLVGEPIPEQYRHHYAPETTHYMRQIGIYDERQDRTRAYECPDCEKQWSVEENV